MDECRRWLRKHYAKQAEVKRRRRAVNKRVKNGQHLVSRDLYGELLPQDWRSSELVPRCLEWLQEGRNSRRGAALRSLWLLVEVCSDQAPTQRFWSLPRHGSYGYMADLENVFHLAGEDTLSSVLLYLCKALLEPNVVEEPRKDEDEVIGQKRYCIGSKARPARRHARLPPVALDRLDPYYRRYHWQRLRSKADETKKKRKINEKEKIRKTAAHDDCLVTPVEEKMLVLTLLAALVVSCSVELALNIADQVLPVVTQLALGLDGKESNKRKEVSLRCAAMELETELRFIQYLHVKHHSPAWDDDGDVTKLPASLLKDSLPVVRSTATHLLGFWIAILPAELINNCVHHHYDNIARLLDDENIHVRVQAGHALAILLVSNLEAKEDGTEKGKSRLRSISSYELRELEQTVKVLSWRQDFKFDKRSNKQQLKTFRKLRNVVSYCQQIEEQQETMDQSKKKQGGEEEEEEEEQMDRDCQLRMLGTVVERNAINPCDFFPEFSMTLGSEAFFNLQRRWHGVLGTVRGDRVEWHVHSWRRVVQLRMLQQIIGPSFSSSITGAVLLNETTAIAEKSIVTITTPMKDLPFNPKKQQQMWDTQPVHSSSLLSSHFCYHN
ncbi:hypothetical protein QOT17_022977 [Balamuthia mandrillaris]